MGLKACLSEGLADYEHLMLSKEVYERLMPHLIEYDLIENNLSETDLDNIAPSHTWMGHFQRAKTGQLLNANQQTHDCTPSKALKFHLFYGTLRVHKIASVYFYNMLFALKSYHQKRPFSQSPVRNPG